MFSLMGCQLLMIILSPDALAAFNSVFFQQSMLAVILMWLFLMSCANIGAEVNNQLNLHRWVGWHTCDVVLSFSKDVQ